MRSVFSIIILFSFIMMNFSCASLSTLNTKSAAYPPGFYDDYSLPSKTVYLTFDDGPSEWTDGILNILKKQGVKGTFFICSNWAPHSTRENNSFIKYKSSLIRMIKDGHAVGNHTVDHKDLGFLSPDKIGKEFDENQELLDRALGKNSVKLTLIRPPFGGPWFYGYPESAKIKVAAATRTRGTVIMWSKDFNSGDSKNWVKGDWYRETPKINTDNAEFKKRMDWIYRRVITGANGAGIVILFHDTHLTTMEILPAIIEKLKSSGYKFKTAEELIKWKWKKKQRGTYPPVIVVTYRIFPCTS